MNDLTKALQCGLDKHQKAFPDSYVEEATVCEFFMGWVVTVTHDSHDVEYNISRFDIKQKFGGGVASGSHNRP